MDIDLSTVNSAMLMPFWLAGGTRPNTVDSNYYRSSDSVEYLSFKDDLAVSKRQSDLLTVFHQECCLLTTVPTNAWISQLSAKVSDLISSYAPKVFESINLHLVGRFLRCLAQRAEISEEGGNQIDAYCSFASMKTDKQPLGQLTGLVSALNLLLLHIPWLNPPTQTQSDISPPRRFNSQELIARCLASPPMLSIRNQTDQSTEEKVGSESHSNSRSLNNSPVSYGLLDALEAVTFILNNHVRDTDSVLWIFSALEPSLDRLIHCCVKAEEAVIAAGTDLDEPLLITQHRQQAKLTLEEVFICIWKQLKIVPPNVSVTNPLSMLNTMQCDQNSKTSVPNSKITRAVALDEQYQGILNLSFALCGYNLESSKGSHKSAPIQLSITFIIWFIGYWNYLVDQCCSTKTNKSKIQNVQNFLKNRESDFQKIVVQAFSLNMQQFNNLDSSEKNTNTYNSTLYKTPKSEPTKRRSRALKKMESSQSPETPINLKLEKEDGSPDSILTTLRSGRRSSLGKNKLESEKLRKPVTASPGLRASTGDSQNLSNSPSIRPRRGRLSLGRNINPVERIVTPTRRSFGPVENITQSAPSNFTARRGRGKKGVNLFPVSPRPSPASGIIADAFGVAPGSSLIEDKGNHNWSPSMPSPGPLSNRPLVKRRLFSGVQDLRTPEDNSSNSYQTSSLHPTRKRHLSDSEHNSVTSPKTVTISTGVEDSCDFVFIPPQTESAKKRRRSLTIHQKERFKEQRSEYVPVTYTELDISQQSWPSLCGSDSQSQSLPEFSPQSSENTKCLEVSETPEFLDCQMVEANNVTNILTSEDEIENSGIKDYTCQVCDKSELTPIKVVLSPLISDPVCSKDCDSKDILEMIHDTEITNNECESVNLDEEVPSKLKTLDLSCETGSNGMSNLPDNNKYDDNNDVLIVETHNSTFVSLPSGSNNNNVPSVAISKPSSKDEDHERMSPVTSLSVPPILNSRPNSHTLSSPLIRGSSRAQKMLALGLQKAAEQTARQKSSSGEQNVSNVSGILSADNSPVLTERKSFSNVFVSPSRLPFSSSATDSPSGIMRNLWSKKKSQRVSFAEQPMIYTIGSLNAFELESDEDNVYQNCSSLNSRKVLHDLTDNTCDFDDLSDNDVESKTHKESSESNQVDEKSSQNDTDLSVTSKEPSNAILISTSISVDTYVDLDASQDSSQSILSETVKSDDQTTPVILPHGSCSNHRRKSASPQRREIPIKRNFSRPKCEKSDQSRKLPRRRPLFMEPLPTTVISDNTETNTTTLSQTNEQYTVFVIDSESTMIADTQPDENDTKTDSVDNPTTVIEQTQLDEEEDECVVIEGSQGSSQVQNGEDQSVCSSGSQIDQLNFSPIPVLSNSEMSVDIQKGISSSQTIVDVLHTNPDNTNNNQSKIISVISNESSDTSSQQNMLSISIANEGDDDEDDNVSADNKENQPESTMIATQEDVERDILDKLSQIANSLPILRPEQRHSILLEALSTFKTIMP
ncbi:unnamed protein product [Heterobilharzia americana]|nr:unnamed protein product [Heterobilharzia americana]